ncbi:hypothetical protein C2845_PM15G03950 [Panicum miliaceum]|uniref:Uncharacterized protein n=1 Tax=Panicum miliaceum TaxID=4540 RepID=A0A3L6Q890_PANMI|nr:hypothetical protein C2845_PM15G03950 [Panicum miliaceum]
MISSTRGYCLHNRTSTNSPSLHKPELSTLHMNLALEILNLTITVRCVTVRCVKSAKERNERSLPQDGKQEDDMMTTKRRPLIMTWSKTAPKGTKRVLPHQQ